MARMAIRISGQRQKHGASLADEIAKWLLRFSGDPLPPPSYSRTLFRSRRRLRPPPPQSSSSSSPLSPSSCRRRPSPLPPLSSCRCRCRPRVFRCRFYWSGFKLILLVGRMVDITSLNYFNTSNFSSKTQPQPRVIGCVTISFNVELDLGVTDFHNKEVVIVV
jgi:hypothetical protein